MAAAHPRGGRCGVGAALLAPPPVAAYDAPAVVRRIVRLRLQRQTGPEIAEALGLPPSTVGRVLQRLGLGRLKQPTSASDPAYVRATPGELVHVDIKGLDRFTTVGHRIHGDRRRAGRRQGLGKDFFHVAVDDTTRLAYAAVYPTQDASACRAFLAAAQRWFATLGIDVQAVMTDNAKAYLSTPVQQQLATTLIQHLTTRPFRPQTNGKAERFRARSAAGPSAPLPDLPPPQRRPARLPGFVQHRTPASGARAHPTAPLLPHAV